MTATVVILLSDKRSGSTLFERELCKHPGIAHVHFTPHTYNETHFWVKAACLLAENNEGFSRGVRPKSYGNADAIRKSIIETISVNVPEFLPPDNDESLVFEGWEVLCKNFACPVFFEKSPQHPHHWAALELMLQWVARTDFEVYFVGLIRNPMAVMFSAQQLFFTPPGHRQFGWMHGNENIQRLGGLVGHKRFHMVRYESMVEEPVKTFAEVCEFIGVAADERIGESVHSESLYKWREDPFFDFRLDAKVEEFALELGYDQCELNNPVKLKPPVWQRWQRGAMMKLKRTQSRAYNAFKRISP